MWACDSALTNAMVNSYQAAGPLFTQALQSFFAAQCALVGDHLWPPDAVQSVLEDPYYDFIVVGAGSAGAVVANRLSEIADWKVLLVEAGGNPTLATEIPQLFYSNINSVEDWDYITQPEEGSCRNYRYKGCAWPRGKTLGGSSSINGMFYVRGNKADYDEWAAEGNKGWSYADVLPYFKKSENFTNPKSKANMKYHGTEGSLNVESCKELHHFEELIAKTSTELGVPLVDDVNGENQMGLTCSLFTIKDGIRHSTARAFLSPIKNRENLHVVKNTQVSKILFKPNSNVVSGIKMNKNGTEITVNIKKELILSAGAIGTPQLMLLSGIGPRKHLEDLKIDVKADLPVGENLQDHPFVPVFYTLPGDRNTLSLKNIFSIFSQYILEKNGPFSTVSPHRMIAFVNTTDPNSDMPDIQYHYVVYPPRFDNLIDIYTKHHLSEEFHRKFIEMNKENYVLKLYTVLLSPKSRGKILLRSKNPEDHPLIYPNYFDNSEDIDTVLRGLKQYGIRFDETETMKEAGFKLEWLQLEACKKYHFESDDFLKCMTRETTFSLYHPTSTAKMGPDADETAVVNPDLKVRKLKRLRVIDASIMPKVVRGNTNAATIMIAEKGADLIKKEWMNKHTEL